MAVLKTFSKCSHTIQVCSAFSSVFALPSNPIQGFETASARLSRQPPGDRFSNRHFGRARYPFSFFARLLFVPQRILFSNSHNAEKTERSPAQSCHWKRGCIVVLQNMFRLPLAARRQRASVNEGIQPFPAEPSAKLLKAL